MTQTLMHAASFNLFHEHERPAPRFGCLGFDSRPQLLQTDTLSGRTRRWTHAPHCRLCSDCHLSPTTIWLLQVLYTTAFSTALSFVASLATQQLQPSILFLIRNPDALVWIAALSLSSAAVQLLISYTIKRYGRWCLPSS